ncbi:mersacidin/lichenicidin family type 2 lantibiotic [Dictyobacter aurantiacus]|uniref:Mersacidin/lichenicidin family type 2 lantibiotic n=1 Tax=Dictyobacter aurantiacus TaxID=1936993 RepID=A0A401ZGI1_9CHLR|nr:mersacidin/lichenicidin family type 2 lantibiotic [Dictyobacter aurantiacus]GCE05962.1 hypothetical protein KDAU_32910 [Dictyobacter aurantiacus]
MSIEEIVKAWKAEESALDNTVPANPIGEELSDEALQEVTGGMYCTLWSCDIQVTCDFADTSDIGTY